MKLLQLDDPLSIGPLRFFPLLRLICEQPAFVQSLLVRFPQVQIQVEDEDLKENPGLAAFAAGLPRHLHSRLVTAEELAQADMDDVEGWDSVTTEGEFTAEERDMMMGGE